MDFINVFNESDHDIFIDIKKHAIQIAPVISRVQVTLKLNVAVYTSNIRLNLTSF